MSEPYCGTHCRSWISEPLKIGTNAFLYQRKGKYQNYKNENFNLSLWQLNYFSHVSAGKLFFFYGAKSSLPVSNSFIYLRMLLKVPSHIQIKKTVEYLIGGVNFKKTFFERLNMGLFYFLKRIEIIIKKRRLSLGNVSHSEPSLS